MSKQEKLEWLVNWLRGPNSRELVSLYGQTIDVGGGDPDSPHGYRASHAFRRGIRLAKLANDHTLWLVYRKKSDMFDYWPEEIMLISVAKSCPGPPTHLSEVKELVRSSAEITADALTALQEARSFPVQTVIDGLGQYAHDQGMYHQNVAPALFVLEGTLRGGVSPKQKKPKDARKPE